MRVNLSQCLVIDATAHVLGGRDIVDAVTDILNGGVTLLRVLCAGSRLAEIKEPLHRVHMRCQEYGVPLLVDGRIDICLEIGCEGTHLTPVDMHYGSARSLLGPNALIGVTVGNMEQAEQAARDMLAHTDPCYIEINTTSGNPGKLLDGSLQGLGSVRKILSHISGRIPIIACLDAVNYERVLSEARAFKKFKKEFAGFTTRLGVLGALDIQAKIESTRRRIRDALPTKSDLLLFSDDLLLPEILTMVKGLSAQSPQCHYLTDLISQNFAVDVALAIGARPLLADYRNEARELTGHSTSLIVSMTTVRPEVLSSMHQLVEAYHRDGRPMLLYPLGEHTITTQDGAVDRVMASWPFSVIMGNGLQIATMFGDHGPLLGEGKQAGNLATDDVKQATLVKRFAARGQNVVIMIGPPHFLSDGEHTLSVNNHCSLPPYITGDASALATTIAAFLAVYEGDKLVAVLAGILLYELAVEATIFKPSGPTMLAILDELLSIVKAEDDGIGKPSRWLKVGRIGMFDQLPL